MVMSSVGAVVLPCVPFYLFPLKSSRSAHRLATGRKSLLLNATLSSSPKSVPPSERVGLSEGGRSAEERATVGPECLTTASEWVRSQASFLGCSSGHGRQDPGGSA